MTIIYKKEPLKPRKKPRIASLAYQTFQDARALAFMQTSLSSDGLFAASSKALGKAMGASQRRFVSSGGSSRKRECIW